MRYHNYLLIADLYSLKKRKYLKVFK